MRAIGLDVHLDFCEVAIAEAGEVRSAGRIETKPDQIELFARSLDKDDRVALEVTGNAWQIKRLIEPHVAEVIVVSPNDTGIRAARAKTDRLDARTLARLLAAGGLDPVWVPDRETQRMRRRLQRRGQLVWSRSRAKNQIHAVLMRCLVGRPPFSDLFGVEGPALARRAGPARGGARVGRLGAAPDRVPRFGDRRGRAADRQGGPRLGGDQAPDDGPRRERDRRRHLPRRDRRDPPLREPAQAGRLPRARSTGEPVGLCSGDPRADLQAGSTRARHALVEASWSTVRQPGPVRAFYERIRVRRGHQVAVVACARKLACLFWCLLSRSEDYAFAQPSLTRKKLRRLELAAGAPSKRGRRSGPMAANPAIRKAERELAEQAEAAYRRSVRDWQATQAKRKGAGATPGRASRGPSSGQAARQVQAPGPAL